jgi:RHS repeat-associated protein
LNQYTDRTVPGYVNDIGTANSNATVTLWSSDGSFAPTYRHGEYFRAELPVTNGSIPLWLTLTNLALLRNGTNADIITNSVGNLFVPKTPETFGYDLDGNETNDGRWTMTWDAENRITTFTSISGAPSPSLKKIVCSYDYLGRRIQKIVYDGSSLVYVPVSTNKYIYDGWNLLAILDATNGLVSSFAWGTDLSGTAQGAGGVGGLLSMSAYSGGNAGTYFYAYDGNGNVSALISAADGSAAAQYEYRPFGELIRATGPAAEVNPFRFSTKHWDAETELLYYALRYYSASQGQFLARDPIDEWGGPNLAAFVANDSINRLDLLGLIIICHCPEAYFAENGITSDMYEKDGDKYTGKPDARYPASGIGEILGRMLQTTARTFKAKNLDVNELKKHVKARQNVVNETANVKWNFGRDSGTDQKYNKAYWANVFEVKHGVSSLGPGR